MVRKKSAGVVAAQLPAPEAADGVVHASLHEVPSGRTMYSRTCRQGLAFVPMSAKLELFCHHVTLLES